MPPIFYELIQEYGDNPFEAMWFLFSHGLGFIILVPAMIYYGWQGWMQYIWERTKQLRPHIMLKVDVPQLNEQSMKAVEQIFVHIYGGAWDTPNNVVESYWEGFFLESFAFEIVSDGGYITFYVRTPTYYRDLVQAAFYAQYPDCSIEEVEDYVSDLNEEMIMQEKVKVWGSELKLERDDTMPIRSWPLWEHGLVGRAVDPLASILEIMSRIQPGEKLWFQIIAQPSDLVAFKVRSQVVIDKLVGDAPKAGEDWVDKVIKIPLMTLETVHDAVVPGEWSSTSAEAKETLGKRIFLTTPEREFVEEVDRKMSRWPFKTKIRFMYFARPDLFDPARGRRGILGALAQYRFINSFQEGELTRVEKGKLRWRYWFPELRLKWRARRMFWAYRSRDMQRGEHDGFIMSTEEVASIFHFPQIEVRAPYVGKASQRGVEPPTQLTFADQMQTSDNPNIPTVNIAKGDGSTKTPPIVNIVTEPTPQDIADQALAQQVPVQTTPPQTVPNITLEPEPDNQSTPTPPSNLPFV